MRRHQPEQRDVTSHQSGRALIAGLIGVAACIVASNAMATPGVLRAFSDHYPTTTLLSRTALAAGDDCLMCHSPPNYGSKGNCYRDALKALIRDGLSEAQAITALDGVDSDNDGTPNGVEITMPRSDMPGQVGYNPGLIGPTGVSPCSTNSATIITGQAETPAACPTDLDDGSGTGTPDGGVDISDLLYFLGEFEAGSSSADLDNGSGAGVPDGGIDINDLLYFLSHFQAGC